MENVNKCKFDIGDLVVRCYKDGFKANCIYYKESSKYDHKDYDYIIYLGKSFSTHGGLSRFDSYGMGIDNFVYRLCTISESFEIINNIIKYREMNNNIEIEYFKDLDNLIIVLNRYIKKIRMKKLEKIGSRL